jgi:uncharacterized membrane protein YfcA
VLGLIGGGGSVLATPLLLYVVGLPPHVAIGTGALAVSVSAFINFAGYARKGLVRWKVAAVFAVTGMVGAAIGSTLGKVFDGQRLLFLFAILMIVVGILMLRRKAPPQGAAFGAPPGRENFVLVVPAALGVGLLAGFFGIGGGFLIVPGLLFSTGMPMIAAIATSLLSVGTFGLTTAVNYSLSGLVDWTVAAEAIGGGLAGGVLGIRLASTLAPRKATLTKIFACVVFAVAAYMLWRTAGALGLR